MQCCIFSNRPRQSKNQFTQITETLVLQCVNEHCFVLPLPQSSMINTIKCFLAGISLIIIHWTADELQQMNENKES